MKKKPQQKLPPEEHKEGMDPMTQMKCLLTIREVKAAVMMKRKKEKKKWKKNTLKKKTKKKKPSKKKIPNKLISYLFPISVIPNNKFKLVMRKVKE